MKLTTADHSLSPSDRWQTCFCFNRCANRHVDVENPRLDYVRSRNWESIALVTDGGILALAENH